MGTAKWQNKKGSKKCTLHVRIEPHLVLMHISYINIPKNPIFKLVTRVNTGDFMVFFKPQNFYETTSEIE